MKDLCDIVRYYKVDKNKAREHLYLVLRKVMRSVYNIRWIDVNSWHWLHWFDDLVNEVFIHLDNLIAEWVINTDDYDDFQTKKYIYRAIQIKTRNLYKQRKFFDVPFWADWKAIKTVNKHTPMGTVTYFVQKDKPKISQTIPRVAKKISKEIKLLLLRKSPKQKRKSRKYKYYNYANVWNTDEQEYMLSEEVDMVQIMDNTYQYEAILRWFNRVLSLEEKDIFHKRFELWMRITEISDTLELSKSAVIKTCNLIIKKIKRYVYNQEDYYRALYSKSDWGSCKDNWPWGEEASTRWETDWWAESE